MAVTKMTSNKKHWLIILLVNLIVFCGIFWGQYIKLTDINTDGNKRTTDGKATNIIACLDDAVIFIENGKINMVMPVDIEKQKDYFYLFWWNNLVEINSIDGNCISGIDEGGNLHFWGDCCSFCYELVDKRDKYIKAIATNSYVGMLAQNNKVTVAFSRYNDFYKSIENIYSSWDNIVDFEMNPQCMVALKSDGHVKYVAEKDFLYKDVNSWKQITDIALTDNGYIIGCDINGKVLLSGGLSENNGQLIRHALKWEKVKKICSSNGILIGLRNDGKVCACGNICQDDIEEVEKWISIKDIAIGTRYVAAIDKDNGVHILYLKE